MAKAKANKNKKANAVPSRGPGQAPPRRTSGNGAQGPGYNTGRVPPINAFDNLPKRRPPNLPGQPGYTEELPAQKNEGQTGRPSSNKKKEGAQGKDEPKAKRTAPPKRNAQKTVAPAKRRRRRKIMGIAVFVVAILLCVTVLGAILLKIDKFEVQGECAYSLEELVAAFGHEEGENLLFSFDAKKEQQNMQQLLPYLESVSIHRRPLGTVVFKVVAAQDYYCVPHNDTFIVLSQRQKVLQIVPTAPDGLVYLEGLEVETAVPGLPFTLPNEEVQQTLNVLLQGIADYGFEGVSVVNVADPMRMYFVWQNRFKVVVGSKSNLDAKLNYVNVLLTDTSQSNLTEADRGTLDVSGYPATPNAVYSPE